ncbi:MULTISPECIES: cell-envelope stress modulator CpxP [Enterobacter]|uniref:cell-envelope stress modulator CpxP n=1 Tax=Enterobacter TaxID=547 RepID=UPI0015EAA0C4|nr:MULTISPECIES: cell-envelope stress modulator CpxP [Enterobacter]HDR2753790.1 cell-envelope stress modulator CpxP [Enterobacter asburiae]QMR75857.1 cell-envelope stress modulator CpxP [Enterobacter sp. RHBSTW-00175]WNT36459.1 cell-envelope stress modulator CpxP [Enterobacter cloacae]HDR2788970.1 cell-envelope stress modulator CpxP [Enterobacter asburiae]HDR2793248.1 cell-envelope stress modulator CpxP [Enterobacter asburiae]
MRKVTAAVMASTLAFSAFSQAAVAIIGDNGLSGESEAQHSGQSHMFDGISLTEHQRQQMRDLMQRARQDQPPVNVSEMETMHSLVTAENFDESAVRAQAEKMAQIQVARQVEMARVRNQMFHLLSPEQQAVLNEKHQQRMDQLREVARMQRSSEMTLFSSNTRSNQ